MKFANVQQTDIRSDLDLPRAFGVYIILVLPYTFHLGDLTKIKVTVGFAFIPIFSGHMPSIHATVEETTLQ